MNQEMRASLAGVAAAMAMMGFTMASRKMGLTTGEKLPKQSVGRLLQAAHAEQKVSDSGETMLGMGAHLGYSVSSAMLYGQLRERLSLPGPLAGALFGLLMWGVNLGGIAPLLGIRQAPWEQEEARALTTLLSHLLFGLVLGVLFDKLGSGEA